MVNAVFTPLASTSVRWAWALRLGNIDDTDFFNFFVATLRASIPRRKLTYDRVAKHWLLTADCLDAVEFLLCSYHLTYTFANTDDTSSGQLMNRAQAAAELYLLPTAPDCVIAAAYKALAKVRHPDCGGSTEAMQRLNHALEVLK